MKSLLGRLIVLGLAICILSPLTAEAGSLRDELAQVLPSESVTGEPFQLNTEAKYHVFLFLGVECPVARQYGAKLQPLAEQFAGKAVQFIGVNSNPQDSRAEVAQYQKDLSLTFANLKDPGQLIAKHFSATRTAEAVVIDQQGQVKYRGRIDDQYSPGVARGTTSSHDLKNALEELLAGLPVTLPETTPVGCLITYLKEPSTTPTVTFTKDVAPLLLQHCYECHRSGEIGPFDISDYDDLQGWGEMLVEVMEQKRMPPWHADPQHGSFRNERHLPDQVIPIVKAWIDQGMPYGNPVDLPPKPQYTEGWRLPKAPDVVIQMRGRPYRIPADKTVDYQYFVVDPGFTEDKWVSASQIIPGAPTVVHHAIVFVRPPDGGQFVGIGWLNAYVPGQVPVIYPEGYARRIEAGSKLVFQMHYTPSGTEELDITKIGINFVDESKVTHQVYTTVAIDQDFEIPPNAPSHIVRARLQDMPSDGELLSISPHMHLRGKAFEVLAKRGQQTETILKVPNYDFNWQHTYEYSQPIPFSDIDQIDIAATFDNSPSNPFNPNPNEYVMWGDQTWEEMTLGYFDVAVKRDRQSKSGAVRRYRVSRQASSESADSQVQLRSEEGSDDQRYPVEFADNFIRKHDRNGDGMIARSEVSTIFGDYGFWTADLNYDSQITRDELIQAARGSRDRRR